MLVMSKDIKEDKDESNLCWAHLSFEHAILKLRIQLMESHQHHNQTMQEFVSEVMELVDRVGNALQGRFLHSNSLP
ncbi:hypothetical protein PR048_018764 [Dryococelus australis]|uniref:Uncharacterized protein n=1 Tax=Dryococelus australis TaxID=614101 RepID=A0ABQ9HDL2_9NEOP|nr:hypothetical protein PR048_018764 [Dryococelus australis]